MSMTIAALLAAARTHIAPAEARLLLGHLLKQSTAWLEAHRDDPVDEAVERQMSALAGRRYAGEPMAYLLGVREFYGRDFGVTPEVLIPRSETELLVDIAKEKVGAGRTASILDMGVGSGCIAVTLALECAGAKVTAVDVSACALAVARKNAQQLGASVCFVESDWFTALSAQRFDLIVANPPYVAAGDPHLSQGDLRFEPPDALTDHADGLADLRHIIAHAPAWLSPQGWLLCEHGYDQADAVRKLLQATGLTDIEQHVDLAGIVRCSGARIAD